MKKSIFIITMIAAILIPLAVVYGSEYGNSPKSECAGFDYWRKFDQNGSVEEQSTELNPISVTLTSQNNDGEFTSFDWSSTTGIWKIVVKSGNDGTNQYEYNSPFPTNGPGSTNEEKEISHLTFCWNEPEPEPTPEPTPDPISAITLTKTANPSTFSAEGDVIDYSYVITNTGNTLLYPPYTVSDDRISVSCPSTPESLASGATISCMAAYTITLEDMNAGSVTNVAVAAVQNEQGQHVTSNQADATVTLDQVKALGLIKTASPDTFSSMGESITYSYQLTNNGNSTLAGPFSVIDDKVTVFCPEDPDILNPSESLICTAAHVISQADLIAGSVTNIARGYAEGGSVASNTDTETIEGPKTEPSIRLDKEVTAVNGNPALSFFTQVGDVISYSFTITNTGNVALNNILISDPSAVIAGSPIESLSPGETDNTSFTAIYTITQTDLETRSLTNTASVTGLAPDGSTVSDDDSAAIEWRQETGSIQLIKEVAAVNDVLGEEKFSLVGDKITYAFTVTNTGDVTLFDVIITDPSAEIQGGPIANLAPGESDSTTFTATYYITQNDLNLGSFTNTAIVAGTSPAGEMVTDEANAVIEKDPRQLY